MNRVLDVDPSRRLARVQPGTILDDLRHAAEQHGLTFGPDPSTHNHCTLGGMIGNNSCGVHSVMAQFAGTGPRTSDQVEWLEILTYDGARMRVGETSDEMCDAIVAEGGRRGADLCRAAQPARPSRARSARRACRTFRGASPATTSTRCFPRTASTSPTRWSASESTCVLVLEAMVRLIPNPKARIARRPRLSERLRGRRPRAADHGASSDRLRGHGRQAGQGHRVDRLREGRAEDPARRQRISARRVRRRLERGRRCARARR